MELKTHGGRNFTERSGRLSLKTLLSSLVTPVVRTEDTITQKLLGPRKLRLAGETCKVRFGVKKLNDLTEMQIWERGRKQALKERCRKRAAKRTEDGQQK